MRSLAWRKVMSSLCWILCNICVFAVSTALSNKLACSNVEYYEVRRNATILVLVGWYYYVRSVDRSAEEWCFFSSSATGPYLNGYPTGMCCGINLTAGGRMTIYAWLVAASFTSLRILHRQFQLYHWYQINYLTLTSVHWLRSRAQ